MGFKTKMKQALTRFEADDNTADLNLGLLSFNQFLGAVMNFIKVDVHMDWLEKVDGMSINTYLMTMNSPRWAFVQSCARTSAGCVPLSPWYVFLIGTLRAEVGSCAIWFQAKVQNLHCLTTPCHRDGTTKMDAVDTLDWGLEAYDGDLGTQSTIPDKFVERVIRSQIDVQ